MKRLLWVAFTALATLSFVGRADAQNTFAPLIQKDTVAVARIDLNQIDAQKLSSQIQKVANAAIDYFVDDAEQAQETKQMLPLATAFASQYFELFVEPFKKAGVGEIYLVVDQTIDAENPRYPYLAIPTADLDQSQIKEARGALAKLSENLGSSLKYRFERNNFLVVVLIPETVDEDVAKTYIKERFTKINSVDASKFADGFELVGDGALFSGVNLPSDSQLVNEQVEAALAQLDENAAGEAIEAFAAKMMDAQDEFSKLAELNAWKVDVNALEIVSFIKTASADNAASYLAKTEEIRDAVADFAEAIIKSSVEDGSISDETSDLSVAAIVDLIDVFIGAMKQNDDLLILKIDEQFFVDNKPTFENLVSTVKKISEEQNSVEEENLDLDEEL